MERKLHSLQLHEWLAMALLLGVIASLLLTSFLAGRGKLDPALAGHLKQLQSDSKIELLVKGAVQHPGLYKIPSGMRMRDLLELAGVEAEADLRRFQVDRSLKRSRVLNIPSREMITVHLQGAVRNPGPLKVPRGMPVKELLQMAQLEPGADAQFLNKKRRLKPDEILKVPMKKG